MSGQKFYTKYSPPPSPSVVFVKPSLTHQEFARDADINFILKRYQETGFLTDPTKPSTLKPMFGDFSNVQDYQTALDALNEADEAFMRLPAKIRDRFANDPGKFLEFAENPENADELVKMGLATKKNDVPVVTKKNDLPVSDSSEPSVETKSE